MGKTPGLLQQDLGGDGSGIDEDWAARPWARTFDLISGEYGWTDDQILDLPLSRVRQIRDVISIRQAAEWKRDVRVRERIMQHQMAATIGAAGGKGDRAYKTRILPDEKADPKNPDSLPSAAAVSRRFPVDPQFGLITDEQIAARAEQIRQQREAA